MSVRIAVAVGERVRGVHLEPLKTFLQIYFVGNRLAFDVAEALVVHDRVLDLREQ